MSRVFGTAGVRGVFNKTQTPKDVYKLVETAAFVMGKGRYGIGWDGRKTSALLGKVAISAVAAVGSDALSFGLVPTPVLAFNTRANECRLGFSITASHNPPEFSGVKMFNGEGMELEEEDEMRIERAYIVNSHKAAHKCGRVVSDPDAIGRYSESLLARFSPAKKRLKVAVDCSNGPGSLVTPRILKKLGHLVIPINAHISWRFPARPPEPTQDTLKETGRIVSGLGVDFALAHDGDADRLVILNSMGQLVSDAILPIVMFRRLERLGTIILSENSSYSVEEEAIKRGLRVVRGKIGKTFARLKKEGAVFACEPSKITDPGWGLWEDGIYGAVCFVDTVSSDPSLQGLLEVGTGWTYKQVNLPVGVRFEFLVRTALEAFKRFKIAEERRLNGLKLIFKDGSWIMFRPSGTEPKTRIYCESRDLMRVEELLQEGIRCVENSAYNLPSSALARQL
jgi:phosphomannomutase